MELAERNRLAYLEDVIEKDLKAYYRVGMALFEIRESRLYRENYPDFVHYCKDRWDMSDRYAHYLISASHVSVNLKSSSAQLNNCSVPLLPANEAQARPLTKLKSPEQQVQVWEMAVETAPDGQVTARHVQKTVRETIGEERKSRERQIRQKFEDWEHLEQAEPEFREAFKAFFRQIERARTNHFSPTSKEAVLYAIRLLQEMAELPLKGE